MKYIDLHIHTSYSDGSLAPADVVKSVYCAGLSAIAITDHDTMSGLVEARQAGKKYGIEIIRGVEVSTNACNGRLHMLGYFCNPLEEPLRSTMRKIRDFRWQRVLAICEKLRAYGIEIDFEKEFSKDSIHSFGRPHIAALMLRKGYTKTIFEAFEKYLADNRLAFVEKWAPRPIEALQMIHQAGGIAVIAHPGPTGYGVDSFIDELIKHGLDGIEVFYPRHTDAQTQKYREIANYYGLVMTGGSDFHGENSDRNMLGIFKIKYPFLEALKERKRIIDRAEV